MKMSDAHYNDLKARIKELSPKIPAHVERLRTDVSVHSVEKRVIWDVFHSTRIASAYTYREFDYTDAHIETAVRRAFKELGVNAF